MIFVDKCTVEGETDMQDALLGIPTDTLVSHLAERVADKDFVEPEIEEHGMLRLHQVDVDSPDVIDNADKEYLPESDIDDFSDSELKEELELRGHSFGIKNNDIKPWDISKKDLKELLCDRYSLSHLCEGVDLLGKIKEDLGLE